MDVETIRTLTVKGKAEGVDEATAAIGKLSDAMAGVVTVTETSAKSTLSVQSALDRQQRSLDSTYASQQKYASAQKTLGQALDQGLISQDRYNTLVGLAADKYNQTTLSSKAFQAALSGVSGQLIALSAGAGPVGVFLSALGPWGVAAAVGIGAVSSAFSSMAESATKFGQAAIETQKFLLATGLTVDQFSSLKRAASDFGITGDEVALRVENFTKQLEGLNDATGPLYDIIRKVNPELANQAVSARGAASEILLVAQAWKQATTAQASQIANQSFGKGGVSLGPLLGSVANQGGLDAMKGAEDDLNKALAEELRQRAAIAAAIQKANDDAEKIYVKLYGDTVQKAQLYLAQKSLEWAEGIKSAAGYALKVVDAFREASLYSSEHTGAGSGGPMMPVPNMPTTFSQGGGATMPLPGLLQLNQKPIDLTATINQFKAYASAIGEAVTPEETLKNKQNELQQAFNNGVLGPQASAKALSDLARAQGVLTQSYDVAKYSAMVSALGSAATPTEQLTDKINQLGLKFREKKIDIDTFNRSVENLKEVSAVDSINRMVSALGSAATPTELETQRIAQLTLQLHQGGITWDTYARSVANTTPQLSQLAQDGGNLAKQLDTLSVGSLNNLGNALGDIVSGTTTLSAGMKNLETQFIKSLTNMVFQMTVAKLAAQGLQSVFSAFLPGVNPTPPGSVGVMGLNGNIPTPTYMAEGGNLSAGNWAVVGERGPELIQTLPGGGANVHSNDNSARILSSGLPGYANGGFMPAPSGSGGNNVQVNVINNASGTSVEHRKSQQGGLDVHDVVISTVNQGIGKGQFDGANRARFGQQVRARPR